MYELGAVAAVIILGRYGVFLFQLSTGYLFLPQATGAALLALVFTLVVFFSNGFVLRAFFGDGDPASVMALFAFVSTRRDVLDDVQASLGDAPSFRYVEEV